MGVSFLCFCLELVSWVCSEGGGGLEITPATSEADGGREETAELRECDDSCLLTTRFV